MRTMILSVMVIGLFVGSVVGCGGRDVHRDEGSATMPVVSSGLRVSIAILEEGKIRMRGQKPAIHVVFENVSDRSLGIIDEWNSWGWFNVKFKYTMSDGIPRVMERINGAWTRNNLTITQLQPGEVLVRDVYFDHDGWEGVPTITQNTPVMIQAVFTQTGSSLPLFKPDPAQVEEARRAGAWIGTAESAPVRAALTTEWW
jgi:hypothetical protein